MLTVFYDSIACVESRQPSTKNWQTAPFKHYFMRQTPTSENTGDNCAIFKPLYVIAYIYNCCKQTINKSTNASRAPPLVLKSIRLRYSNRKRPPVGGQYKLNSWHTNGHPSNSNISDCQTKYIHIYLGVHRNTMIYKYVCMCMREEGNCIFVLFSLFLCYWHVTYSHNPIHINQYEIYIFLELFSTTKVVT